MFELFVSLQGLANSSQAKVSDVIKPKSRDSKLDPRHDSDNGSAAPPPLRGSEEEEEEEGSSLPCASSKEVGGMVARAAARVEVPSSPSLQPHKLR